ncbi:MAG: DUF4160 domain-containing protein [Bryobacteraceae bacterium]
MCLATRSSRTCRRSEVTSRLVGTNRRWPIPRPQQPLSPSQHGEFEATIEIGTLEVLEGQLPRRALNLVKEWAMMHREELFEDWRFCRENTVPAKIEPLARTESLFHALGRSRSQTRAPLLPLCTI